MKVPNEEHRSLLVRDFANELIKAFREKAVYDIPIQAGHSPASENFDLSELYREAFKIALGRLTKFEQNAVTEFWNECPG